VHIVKSTGFGGVQLVSDKAAMPSLRTHATVRVTRDLAESQFVGQAAKSAATQLYVTQAAVAAHTFDTDGFACVQLDSIEAALPSLPMHTTARVCVDSAAPQSAGHTSANSAATQLYAMQSAVAAQILVLNGFACVQVESVEAAMPLLPMHDTARVCVDSPKPQSVEQAAKSAAIQLYVTQAAVATQTFVVAGFACVQLESVEAAMPLLPMHVTARDCVDSAVAQSFGQEAKSAAIHSYVTQAAVATQTFVVVGFACVQLESVEAAMPLLPMHATARVCVDSPKPQSVGQAEKSGGTAQLYCIVAAAVTQYPRLESSYPVSQDVQAPPPCAASKPMQPTHV
jgi:hypothetical protein